MIDCRQLRDISRLRCFDDYVDISLFQLPPPIFESFHADACCRHLFLMILRRLPLLELLMPFATLC